MSGNSLSSLSRFLTLHKEGCVYSEIVLSCAYYSTGTAITIEKVAWS
jgi:hypothetical protein